MRQVGRQLTSRSFDEAKLRAQGAGEACPTSEPPASPDASQRSVSATRNAEVWSLIDHWATSIDRPRAKEVPVFFASSRSSSAFQSPTLGRG
jgi:hypothetical protein